MADDKKISPKEAAVAVLKKFIELSTASTKVATLRKDEEPAPADGGQTINSQIGNPFGKSDEKQDAELGEKVENDVEQHMEHNKDAEQQEGHEMPNDHMKGHIKLAKFIGHIQGKKSVKGGINQDSGNNTSAQPIGGHASQGRYRAALDPDRNGRTKGRKYSG